MVSEDDLKLDDNVWNDRKSDDFLRYMKHDFFILVYMIAQFINNLVYGMSDVAMIKYMGPRDMSPTGVCTLIFLVMRGF